MPACAPTPKPRPALGDSAVTSTSTIDPPNSLPDAKRECCLGYEAITHACKHANATHLWIDVVVSGLAVVRVENDGTGPVSKRRNSYRWRTLSNIATQHDLYLAIEPRAPCETTIEITAA